MDWIFIIFSIGLIIAIKNYYRPPKPESTDSEKLLAEYRSLCKRYNLLCSALFFFLILQHVDKILGR